MKLLDTDVLSSLARRQPPPGLEERFFSEREPLCSSAVNLAEIYYGIARRPERQPLLDMYRDHIFPCLIILDFDDDCAPIAGQIQAELEARRQSIGWADLMIAAIALHHGATVVTGNTQHFARIPGLRLENWLG